MYNIYTAYYMYIAMHAIILAIMIAYQYYELYISLLFSILRIHMLQTSCEYLIYVVWSYWYPHGKSYILIKCAL